jgi:flagellar FliJ protein
MTISGGLVVAMELATSKRDAAGQALAQVIQRHAHAVQQLEQLQAYATDTQGRWSVSARTSTTPQIVGHYYQFMAQLDHTVGLQQGVIADVQRQCQAARQVLLDAEVMLAGLQRLLDKRRRERQRRLAQREQQQTDEFANRRRTVVLAQRDDKECP